MKHYRFDRMAYVNLGSSKDYMDFPTKRTHDAAIKRFIDISVSAFSGGIPIALPISIKGITLCMRCTVSDVLRESNR